MNLTLEYLKVQRRIAITEVVVSIEPKRPPSAPPGRIIKEGGMIAEEDKERIDLLWKKVIELIKAEPLVLGILLLCATMIVSYLVLFIVDRMQ